MQSNDMDNRVSGSNSNSSEVGTEHRPENEQKFKEWCVAMSTGYRWLEVNDFLHIYMSVSVVYPNNMPGGGPNSEVLAYVQHLPSGKFRALRTSANGNIVMPIPYGPANEVILAVEKYMLAERQEQDIQG